MNKKPDRHETDDESFDLKEAKAHYIAMPRWEQLALWIAIGAILLGILGDLVW
jgi:hypothetical protein